MAKAIEIEAARGEIRARDGRRRLPRRDPTAVAGVAAGATVEVGLLDRASMGR
jgi:hypothetical protein